MRAGILSLVLLSSVSVIACGGKKESKDPSEINDPKPSGNDDTPKWEGATTPPPPPANTGGDKPTTRTVNEGTKQRTDQYDKEATEVVLKRSARQVKENCGAAKGEDGKASGPWGKATLQVQLGRNGHSKGVTIPEPYNGKPVGNCVEKAFTNLTFPPWGGSDTTVDWEVELVQPK